MKKGLGYRLEILRNLYPYAYGVKRYWGILFVFSALTVVMEFVIPLIYKFFINDVILSANLSKLYIVIAGYLITYLVGALSGYIKIWSQNTVVNTILYRVRQKILKNYMDFPFSEYETACVGDMKMRIDDDTNQINEFAYRQTISYMISCATIVISAVILFDTNWILAMFSVIAIPLTFWLDNLISKYEKVVTKERRENSQIMSSWLHAYVQGWREVRALNLAKHEMRYYYQLFHKDMIYNAKWINFWTARALIIPKIKDDCFMQFGLYFIGGLLIIAGNLKISDLLVFASYYSLLSNAVQAVSTSNADLQSKMPYTDHLMESLVSKAEDMHNVGIIPDRSHTIILQNVSFKYPDAEKDVVKNLNLTIEKGERVAIVGKSGSGKTTLLKLITGMLRPTEGQIFFSGVDMQSIDISAMHSRIGFVMQENILFHTTIKENLLYGKKEATDKELWEACRKACIYDFIMNLPEGMNTTIGEKGIKLSGGQRQRLVLARTFLQNIDIFIFDEATSALDQYSESIVQDTIENISKDKTIIVVAHREFSIRICDRVVRINEIE